MNKLLNLQIPPDAGMHHVWCNLHGSSQALAIAQAARQTNVPILVVVNDPRQAFAVEQALRFFITDNTVPIVPLPDWETLPYDHFSPHQDIVSQRISSLAKLPSLTNGIIIVPISTLMHRLAPVEYIAGSSFLLQCKDKLNLTQIRETLQQRGYYCVNQVLEHGEFSLRGAIFDIFPMGSETPYRIELFDDEVDTIRTFDVETQRSFDKIEQIGLLPAKEFPLNEQAITLFRQTWRELFSGNPSNCPIYQDISQGICSAGIEYYLPLFFSETGTLFDYLPSNSLVIRLQNTDQAATTFWQEINERYEQLNVDLTKPCLPPKQVFIQADQVNAQIKNFKQITITDQPRKDAGNFFDYASDKLPDLTLNHRLDNPLIKLEEFLQQHSQLRILFCVESAGRRESLLSLLHKQSIFPAECASWEEFLSDNHKLGIAICAIETSCLLPEQQLALISENQLLGQQVLQTRRRKRQRSDVQNIVRNLAELTIGSPVVHIDYGVGRYLGLQTLDSGDKTDEFLTIEYAGGDKLYVPIANLDLISRYSGVEVENAPLHRLGGNKWEKIKKKAAEKMRDIAVELLEMQAQRAAQKGNKFVIQQDYHRFCATFPFEETPDQEQAIQNIEQDLNSEKITDRLICGDVGFGKTEVAMRAAFICAQNNKQTAILVPTTLLAQQHFQSFSDRFADWPINIEMISRFRSAKQQKQILQQLADGKVDIVIGTHKLLQNDIQFKSLGLLIIDEEHRFGVKQKERLKHLRAEVDLITLTATPIPRTLNIALSGVRDLSIIATPPAKRLSIKTFVHQRRDHLIREAILREILRGGQVFFLHNKVETIQKVADELQKLIPEARIGVGHGQMRERELEQVMSDFYHQRFNLLVCTTIIENGIDVPTANTIVIDRADRFGLAQLHQLRGRVGRSHHQAYAYLLIPDKKLLSKDAEKRLDAISQLEDLGVGFTLASHDLEIRGAGELLGDGQSGQIQEIGLTLYTELLDKTVKTLQTGGDINKVVERSANCEIDLKISSLIPEDYLPDVHTRLILYKRIAHAENNEQLDDLRVEIIDRFGVLPQAARNLFEIAELKLSAQQLGITKIDAANEKGIIKFCEKPKVDSMAIIQLIQQQPNRFQLRGADCLQFQLADPDKTKRTAQVDAIMQQLSNSSSTTKETT